MACGLERSRYGDLGPGHGEAVSAAAQILHRDLLAVLVGYVDLIDLIACVGGDGDGDGIALGGLTGIDGDGAAVCFDGSHGRGGRSDASAATAARAATAAASASTATAGGGLLRPVGVEGGVISEGMGSGDDLSAALSCREPASELVAVAGRSSGYIGSSQLAVRVGRGSRRAGQCAAVGVKGDGEGGGCGRFGIVLFLNRDGIGHVARDLRDGAGPDAVFVLGELHIAEGHFGDLVAIIRRDGERHRGACGILVTDLVGTGQGHGVVLGAFCGGVCDREEVQLAGFDRDIQIPRQVFDDQIFGQAGIRGPVVLPCGHVGGAVGAVVGKFHPAARSDGIAGSNGLPIRSGRDIVRKLYGEVRHGLEGD